MDRRGFLKLMGAGVSAIAIPDFVLACPQEIIPAMPVQLAAMRSLSAYDIYRDTYIFRLDAYNPTLGKQWCVEWTVDFSRDRKEMLGQYLEKRNIAKVQLEKKMALEKWRLSDIVLLPTPDGYAEPKFLELLNATR